MIIITHKIIKKVKSGRAHTTNTCWIALMCISVIIESHGLWYFIPTWLKYVVYIYKDNWCVVPTLRSWIGFPPYLIMIMTNTYRDERKPDSTSAFRGNSFLEQQIIFSKWQCPSQELLMAISVESNYSNPRGYCVPYITIQESSDSFSKLSTLITPFPFLTTDFTRTGTLLCFCGNTLCSWIWSKWKLAYTEDFQDNK